MEYLPAIARRLHHCRDLSEAEPFDFLTWFEFAKTDTAEFDKLLARLRTSEEWKYVEREVEVRLVRDNSGGKIVNFQRSLITPFILFVCARLATAEELYRWRPVRLGTDGLVTGFVTHPLDAQVRYCRTDVGNAYRWSDGEWRPLLVRDGRGGLPAELTSAPAVCGVESIALDPREPRTVWLAFNGTRPDSLKKSAPSLPGNIDKSPDGGVTFSAGNLALAMPTFAETDNAPPRWEIDSSRGPSAGEWLLAGILPAFLHPEPEAKMTIETPFVKRPEVIADIGFEEKDGALSWSRASGDVFGRLTGNTRRVPGKIGSAIEFNAKDEFSPAVLPIEEELRLPDTAYSVAFWFKTTAKNLRLCQAKRYTSYNNRWSDHIVSIGGGRVRLALRGDDVLETLGAFNNGQWHHVVTTVTRVGQRVPKKLLTENGAPTATDKRHLQDGIEELLWLAALKPTNIGVPAFREPGWTRSRSRPDER